MSKPLGSTDGSKLIVGLFVGRKLGELLGSEVGLTDGELDGRSLGEILGLWEGAAEICGRYHGIIIHETRQAWREKNFSIE